MEISYLTNYIGFTQEDAGVCKYNNEGVVNCYSV